MRTIFILLLLVLAGCKKEEPNPEVLDPIYKDLSERADAAQKGLDAELKRRADLEVSLAKTEANSIDRKNVEKDLEKSKKAAGILETKARYYGIRAKRRKLVDKIAYQEAFAKNLPWPDPNEYPQYKLNMHLNEVNLNWNTRVPKLQTRAEPAKKAEAPAAPAEH